MERSRLASCSKQLHKLLPPLLQIKVVSSSSSQNKQQQQQQQQIQQLQRGDNSNNTSSTTTSHFHSLMSAFFVTPVIDEDEYYCDEQDDDDDDMDMNNNQSNNSHNNFKNNLSLGMDRCLLANDNLIYGQQYYLWTFDYTRGNRVYLGRHTRHGIKDTQTGIIQHRYSMGLRPKTPNQTWTVVGPTKEDGDVVMWGDNVGLSVGGNNPHPRLPDSHERQLLSCLHDLNTDSATTTTTPPSTATAVSPTATGTTTNNNNNTSSSTWCTVSKEWGINEMLQLLPVDQFVPGPDVEEKELNVHAIPEACDEGEYLLHSPKSLQDGLPTCDGFHVIVKFDFWMEKGVMNFYAPVLPFALGIPILESDYCTDSDGYCHPWNSKTTGPISNLLDIKSARWGCLIYYMAVAADITEGKTLDMDRFLRRVTDHEDHTVRINQRMDYVYIDVKGKKVDQNAPEIPRHFNTTENNTNKNGLAPWCFVLSW